MKAVCRVLFFAGKKCTANGSALEVWDLGDKWENT